MHRVHKHKAEKDLVLSCAIISIKTSACQTLMMPPYDLSAPVGLAAGTSDRVLRAIEDMHRANSSSTDETPRTLSTLYAKDQARHVSFATPPYNPDDGDAVIEMTACGHSDAASTHSSHDAPKLVAEEDKRKTAKRDRRRRRGAACWMILFVLIVAASVFGITYGLTRGIHAEKNAWHSNTVMICDHGAAEPSCKTTSEEGWLRLMT